MKTLLLLCFVALPAYAQPVAVTSGGNVTITLTDEKCALPAITNLPYRATWREGAKTFEGCFGVDRSFGAVALYFDDKTVAFIPVAAFERATSL